jgi:tetratricopeptide (TPR) repeat protein
LRAAKPDTEAAVTAVRKFLSYTSEKSSFLKRQGRAAFELGKHLIENMGGFDADRTKLTDSQKEIVQQAIGYLRTATEKEQSSGEYHLYLGRALALSGHTDAAIASLQAATEREDKKPEYLFHLASECSRAGRLAEAIDALKRAVTIKPDDVDTRDLLAKTCLRAGDYEELERQARKLLKLRGKAPADVALLLRALYHQGRHAVVIKEIESRPEGTISPEISAEAVFAVAHSYLHTGDAEKAVAWFEGIAKDPRWLYPFACALAHLGRIDEAQIRLTELLTAPGEWAAKGQNLRANLCLRQNLLPAAEEAGRAGVSLAPEDLEAHYTLGCVLYRKGEFEKAREEFEFVVERQPNHARAHLALGMIAEQARENAEAIEHYECIAESDAEAPIARLRLGIMACRQHDYARAYPLLHGLEGPEADSDAHLFYLATAQLFCGRTDEAIHMWEKLRSRHPGDQELLANIVRARYLYGSHLAREEKHVQAIAEWDEYLKVFPQDTKVVKDHAKLCFRAAWQAIRSGALVEAETLLRRAVDGDAEESAYSFHLALCEMRLGRANDALPRLNALKKDAVYGPRAGYHIGICLLQLNRASDAVTELERALRNAPAPYAQCAAWAMANEKLRHEKVRDAMDMLTACL